MPPTVTKASGNCTMSSYDWIDQHVRPTDKIGPLKSKIYIILVLCSNDTSPDTHTIKADNQIQNKYDATSA